MLLQVFFSSFASAELFDITKEHMQGIESRFRALVEHLTGLFVPALIKLEFEEVVVLGIVREQSSDAIAVMVADNCGVRLGLIGEWVPVFRWEIGTAHSRSQLHRVSRALLGCLVGLTDLAKLAMSVMAFRVELLPSCCESCPRRKI